MKVKAFTILFALILLLSVPSIPAKEDGISNKSVSGCSCHNGGDGLAELSINLPNEYIAAQTYSFEINVTSQGLDGGGGFNLAASLGTLSTTDSNAKMISNEVVHSNSQSNSWVVNWFAPPKGSGIVTFTLAGLIADGNGQKSGDGWDILSIDVLEGNLAPVISNVELLPSNPTSSESLELSYDYFDNENDLDTSSIIWFKNGEIDFQGTASNPLDLMNVDYSETKRGDLWAVQILPSDGENTGTMITKEVTVINSKPVISNLTIVPSGPSQHDDITANWDEYDEDEDELSSTIRWFKNGLHQIELDGEITVNHTYTMENEEWYFSINSSDSFEFHVENSSTVILNMVNDVPSLENVRITNGKATTISDLVAEWDFLDGDGDDQSNYETRWYADNSLQVDLSNLKLIDSNFTSKNQSWHFEVRATDGVEFSEWYLSENLLINNSIPETTAQIIPLNPTNSSDLELNLTLSDLDGDILFVEVEWLRNGTMFEKYIYSENGPNGPTSNDTIAGEEWYANITVSDGESTIKFTTGSVTIFPEPLSNDAIILENLAKETYVQSITYGILTMVTFMLLQLLMSIGATRGSK